jgi:hypothetical protein
VALVGVGDAVGAANLLLVVGADHLGAGGGLGRAVIEVHHRDQVVPGQREPR